LEKTGGSADEKNGRKRRGFQAGAKSMATLEKTDITSSRWGGLGLLLFVLTGLSLGALLAVLSAS